MKHLKISIMLLLTVAIFTSCEKETTTVPENPAMNVQDIKTVSPQVPMSILDLINSGIDLETYFNSLQKQENSAARPAYSRIPNPNLQFYYSAEDEVCLDLPTENFDLSSGHYGSCTSNYLDDNTYTYAISPGDILPGISFETVIGGDFDYVSRYQEWYGYESYEEMESYMNNLISSCSFYVDSEEEHALRSAYDFTDLVINFSGNNVKNVSLDLISYNYGNEIIEIYGTTDNLLGTDVVYLDYNIPAFWGVRSLEPISKIVIKLEYIYGHEGIDNVSFGNCVDLDGDGVLNENDPYPISNMSETINIGGNYLNIDNVFTGSGTTMMDQIDALIAEINAQYNGDNYDELHRDFTRALSKITYYWSKDRLITRRERSAISSAAWRASIPYSEIG